MKDLIIIKPNEILICLTWKNRSERTINKQIEKSQTCPSLSVPSCIMRNVCHVIYDII